MRGKMPRPPGLVCRTMVGMGPFIVVQLKNVVRNIIPARWYHRCKTRGGWYNLALPCAMVNFFVAMAPRISV